MLGGVGEVAKRMQLDPLYPMDFDSDVYRDPFGSKFIDWAKEIYI